MFFTVSSPICLRVSTSSSESDDMENWRVGARSGALLLGKFAVNTASSVFPGASEDVQGYGSAMRRMIRLEKNAEACDATMQCTLWILAWRHHVRASHAAGAHHHMQVDRQLPVPSWNTHGSNIIPCVLEKKASGNPLPIGWLSWKVDG